MADVENCKMKYRKLKKKKKYTSYVAHFANGRVKPEKRSKIGFKGLHCKTAVRYKNKMLIGKTKRLKYVGKNFGNVNKKSANYYIGVLNKRTGKLKMYDTELFDCKPAIRSTIVPNARQAEKTRGERIQEVTSIFGSKVRKHALATMKQHQVENSNIEASITEAVKESITDIPDPPEVSIDEDSHIPPQNPNAVTPAEIYNIDDIVPNTHFPEINTVCSELRNATMAGVQSWKQAETYPTFVTNYLIRNVKQISYENAKMLVFYNYLLEMYKLNYKDLQRGDILQNIPSPIRSMLLDKYTVKAIVGTGKKTRKMPPRMRDKLLAHCIIIALFLEDFQVKLEVIQKDFSLTSKRMKTVVHALGCHTSNKKESGMPVPVAVLKMPLFVPRTFVKKR